MIDATPYFSFENAKEELSYYQLAVGAYDITRTAITPEFAKQLQVDAYRNECLSQIDKPNYEVNR